MQEGLEEEPESAQEKGAASARERDERETEMAAVFVPQPDEDLRGEETSPPSEVRMCWILLNTSLAILTSTCCADSGFFARSTRGIHVRVFLVYDAETTTCASDLTGNPFELRNHIQDESWNTSAEVANIWQSI